MGEYTSNPYRLSKHKYADMGYHITYESYTGIWETVKILSDKKEGKLAVISVFACLLQSQNSSFPEVLLGWAAYHYHHLSSGASGKFHCCQNPTFCIHVVLDQDERLIVEIY